MCFISATRICITWMLSFFPGFGAPVRWITMHLLLITSVFCPPPHERTEVAEADCMPSSCIVIAHEPPTSGAILDGVNSRTAPQCGFQSTGWVGGLAASSSVCAATTVSSISMISHLEFIQLRSHTIKKGTQFSKTKPTFRIRWQMQRFVRVKPHWG